MEPSYVAVILARSGSKGIKDKNIVKINGKPLIYWVCKAVEECNFIENLYVLSNNANIASIVKSFGFSKLNVHSRNPSTETDDAPSETALIEFAEKNCFKNIFLIQATSPQLVSKDLDKACEIYNSSGFDSLLSVVKQKRFLWSVNNGEVRPLNYDLQNRPQRQNSVSYFVENGAFYLTNRENLLKSRCRISGRIGFVEMNEYTYFEVDSSTELLLIEAIMRCGFGETLIEDLISF